VRLAVNYFLNGTYTNSYDGGHLNNWEGCQAGSENASFAIKVGFASKLHLAEGAGAGGNGRGLSTGQWSEVGTQWNPSQLGNYCSQPGVTKPVQCTGPVGTVETANGGSSLNVVVHKHLVYFTVTTVFTGDANGDAAVQACGTPGWVLPYLGLTETLDPWRGVLAVIPLAKLAAQHNHSTLRILGGDHPSSNLPFKTQKPFPAWNPSTCNGRDGSPGNIKCRATLSIASVGLSVRVG
jgi:hypothetical protein